MKNTLKLFSNLWASWEVHPTLSKIFTWSLNPLVVFSWKLNRELPILLRNELKLKHLFLWLSRMWNRPILKISDSLTCFASFSAMNYAMNLKLSQARGLVVRSMFSFLGICRNRIDLQESSSQMIVSTIIEFSTFLLKVSNSCHSWNV